MEQQKIDMFISANRKYLPEEKMIYLKDRLKNTEEEKFRKLTKLDMINPTTVLLVSIFLGGLGIDRFMLGDIGMGVLKLLTGGCCGVLTVIDWFITSKKAKEINFNNIMSLI